MQPQTSKVAVGGVILLGMPGAGKGTQAEKIQARYGIPAISTGQILRDNVQRGTAMGREADPIMKSGGLVPDSLVNRMIEDRLQQPDVASGFILDGYPRTAAQAEALDALLVKIGRRPPCVVQLDVSVEKLLKQMSGRRSCSKCGRIFNIYLLPPKTEGICDDDGTPLIQRADDQEEVIRQRLVTYEKQTAPVVDHYKKLGRLQVVNGSRKVDEIATDIAELLEKHAASA